MEKIPAYLRKILDHPLKLSEIRRMVDKDRRESAVKKIRELVKTGEIVKIRGGRYGLAEQMNLVTGVVQGHPDGFGFVLSEEEGGRDVYIGSKNFQETMHGDRVICRVESSGHDGKLEGRVIRILERANKTVTGVYQSRGKGGLVVPSQKRIIHDIHIPAGGAVKAESGQLVTARITEYPQRHQQAQGEVMEILGFPGDAEAERMAVIRHHKLPDKFPREVERSVLRFKEPGGEEVKERLDLRNEWIITIDGETAKDFDDAVSIKKLPRGYELGVHIADVSHYVLPDATLDREAYKRGNSTYFPGSVIPMLPFRLSDNICSLKPDVLRLTLSAITTFTNAGVPVKTKFERSVIRSRHRMTYTEVARIIEKPESEPDREKADKLLLMKELSDRLAERRMAEGSIDFDLPEPEIILDMQGEPEAIIRAERNCAHRLIEEFMLAANRQAALFLSDRPSLYRIHEKPDSEAIENFLEFAGRLGYKNNPKKGLSNRLQEILIRAAGKVEEKLLNYIMLRSMKKAGYSPKNIGHFGLGFADYTHFTSPIRRYPDLVVHRAIKEKLKNSAGGPNFEKLLEIGRNCDQTEQTSVSAERDVVNGLKVKFMADHEGEEFDGIISGITSFGIFVELNEIFVEGLLRLTDLHDDYYEFHEKEYSLIGKRKRRVFKLGSPIKVRIKHVNLLQKEISMEPADRPKTGGVRKKIKRGRRRGKRLR